MMMQLATRGIRTMSNADIRGRFIWHELMTTDTDAAAAFYSKVVPWKTQDSGMPSYTLWMAGKNQVGGLTGLPQESGGAPPHWIVYIATPDVDATVADAERLGSKVLKGATDIPNMGRYAVLTDPQGATFAVYTPPGAPPDGAAPGGPGEFTWHELATTDQEAALSFYVELFGWEKGPAHDMGPMGIYQIIKHGGTEVGGIFTLQAPSTPPHWLSYVRVADCTKATNAAKAAGGRVLNGPMEVPDGSWITQMEDPQGGSFAVVEPPKAQAQKPAARKSSGRIKAAAKADSPPSVSQVEMPLSQPAAPEPVEAAPKKKAPRKAARKAVKKAAKSAGRRGAAKKSAAGKAKGKKAAAKAAKKPSAAAKSAKRGKPADKKAGGKGAAAKKAAGKKAAGKKAKRR
jgi:predicted enzyme related to lactoylglutathione lyase